MHRGTHDFLPLALIEIIGINPCAVAEKDDPLRVNLTAIFSITLELESSSLQQITSSGLKIKQTTAG